MAEVKWLPEALQDLHRLHSFLYQKNQGAAKSYAEIIIKGTQMLEESPSLGRPIDDDTGRRELFMPFGTSAYVLRYKLAGADVVIMRIWHSRENWK
jgi:plasmid stabilization system protein ParE